MRLTIDNSASFINKWKTEIGDYPNKYTGQGIVMVAGGTKYMPGAYASIRLLRHLGCQLPIQVSYINASEEISEVFSELEKLNVSFVNAAQYNSGLENPHKALRGWELKPFSIIHSPFEEVLFLDADVICKDDPTIGFLNAGYLRTGSYFFPDFNRLSEERSFWKLYGLEYVDEPEFESGVIFIDKKKCWKELNLTNKICEYGHEFFFKHHHGDKEAFHAAWSVFKTPYHMEITKIHRIESTMVQHLSGVPFFYHRNMSKLDLIKNKKIKGFAHEDLCFVYLEELKTIWNPYKLENEDNVNISGEYDYIRVGVDKRSMTFYNGIILKGSGRLEKSYSIKNGKLHMIGESGEITCIFTRWDEGWVGRWDNYEKCICLLVKKG